MPPLTYIHASESARTTAGGRGVGYFWGEIVRGIGKKLYLCSQITLKCKKMATTTTYKSRTREEVRAWFLAAKARKEAKTKDVEFQWEERRRILDTLIGLETE